MSSKHEADDIEPLKAFRKAVAARNVGDLASALRILIAKEPRRWRELLLIDGGLKDPHSKGFGSRFAMVTEAGRLMIGDGEADADGRKVLEVAAAAAAFLALFLSVRSRLESAAFLMEPQDHQKLRLVAYVESQWFLALKESAKLASNGDGTINTYKLQESAYQAPLGAKVNVGAVLEGSIDCVELVLRYIQHNGSRADASTDLSSAKLPYVDPDFEEVLVLASKWLEYEDAWTRFKFLGWTLRPSRERKGVLVLAPEEVDDLVRYEVGVLRDGQYQFEFQASTRSAFTEVELNEVREQVGHSINVPPAGQEWNGFVDLVALQTLCEHSVESARTKLWIEAKHYSETVAALNVDGPLGRVTWEEWLDVIAALRELAHAFTAAFAEQVPDRGGNDCLRLAVVARPEVLANVLSVVLSMDKQRCLVTLAALTFDATRKSLEIYDQPLVPLSGDRLIFAPGLVSLGMPSRNVESVLAQWYDASGGIRGSTFEDAILSVFAECAAAKTAKRVSFASSDGRDIEYDVIVNWDGYLFLLECKFLRGVHSPAAAWRASNEVEHAIQQLTRQKNVALQEWGSLRAAASGLGLAATAPAPEKVIRIVVASVSHFTGQREDDLFVIDERCLARFFGSREVEARTMAPDGTDRQIGVLDTVRESSDFLVQEFLRYLVSPAPVNLYRAGLSVALRRLPIVEDHNPRILVARAEFKASDFSDKFSPQAREDGQGAKS
jgi:hypothetical protein